MPTVQASTTSASRGPTQGKQIRKAVAEDAETEVALLVSLGQAAETLRETRRILHYDGMDYVDGLLVTAHYVRGLDEHWQKNALDGHSSPLVLPRCSDA